MLADRVRIARRNAGLTWESLAYKAGVSVATIARIERGRQPNHNTLAAVAEALGLTVEELANGQAA